MSYPQVPATPLDPARTERSLNLRNGRREQWGATSLDGRFHYGRGEEVGTWWRVTYLPTGHVYGDLFPTLLGARRWTASDLPATAEPGATPQPRVKRY